MTRFNILLFLLLLFFGLLVVFFQQKHHVLYGVLESEMQIAKKLDREYMQLQLEESQLSALILIEKKSMLDLGMHPPAVTETQFVFLGK